jgi:predicted O-methyltransferase YrrM
VIRRVKPSPVQARHGEYSMVYSEDDEGLARPSQRVLDLASGAIDAARRADLSDLSQRLSGRFSYVDDTINLFPGEHYRLLAGLVSALRPKLIIEIGTAEGLSALAMRKYQMGNARLVTFDVVGWNDYPRTCLTADDFASGCLEQRIVDLGVRAAFETNRLLFEEANLIFLDAPKDGVFEPALLAYFATVSFKAPPILFMDDIRLWNMLAVWRNLRWPKLDLTSFGHWAGSGMCEVNNDCL